MSNTDDPPRWLFIQGNAELLKRGPFVAVVGTRNATEDGIEATRRITSTFPDTFVILVSTYTEADMPPAARTCGAVAYVNKDELSPRVLRRLWESGGDQAWLGNS